MSIPSNSYQLLGGQLMMLSTEGGYRAAIDPVLLAAAVPAAKGDQILDVGCGTGAAALCLATRVSGTQITGLDQQETLIELAWEITQMNGLAARVQFHCGDLLHVEKHFKLAAFDHVMTNPPHHKKGSGNLSPDPLNAAANFEGDAVLEDWVVFCFEMVKEGGSVTFVHRYDRLDELVELMARQGRAVTVYPLWPKETGKRAKRVLVQTRKGISGDIRIADGMILHSNDDEYTTTVHAILREAGALKL